MIQRGNGMNAMSANITYATPGWISEALAVPATLGRRSLAGNTGRCGSQGGPCGGGGPGGGGGGDRGGAHDDSSSELDESSDLLLMSSINTCNKFTLV